MLTYDGRENWMSEVLASMKADLPEIVYGESPKHPLYKDLKSFCDNPRNERLLETNLLKSYLRSANTPRAAHYLCIIEGEDRQ
jgi:hypothetical protein